MINILNERISNRAVIATGLVCWFTIYLLVKG